MTQAAFISWGFHECPPIRTQRSTSRAVVLALLLLAAVFPEVTRELWLSPPAFFRLPLAVSAASDIGGSSLFRSRCCALPGSCFSSCPPPPLYYSSASPCSVCLLNVSVPWSSVKFLSSHWHGSPRAEPICAPGPPA